MRLRHVDLPLMSGRLASRPLLRDRRVSFILGSRPLLSGRFLQLGRLQRKIRLQSESYLQIAFPRHQAARLRQLVNRLQKHPRLSQHRLQLRFQPGARLVQLRFQLGARQVQLRQARATRRRMLDLMRAPSAKASRRRKVTTQLSQDLRRMWRSTSTQHI